MKRPKLLIILFTLVLLSCYQEQGKDADLQERIVGTWQTLDTMGETITFILNEDHSASLAEGNVIVISDSLYDSVTWTLAHDEDPMHLDIASSSNGTERVSRMIVRFLSDSMIELRYPGLDGIRPVRFEEYHELQQIFKRQ